MLLYFNLNTGAEYAKMYNFQTVWILLAITFLDSDNKMYRGLQA